MMPIQRTRDAESRVRNKLSNGPRRVQSNAFYAKYSATCGIRQLPGICRYPAKCTDHSRESRWHRGKDYPSLTNINYICQGLFYMS